MTLKQLLICRKSRGIAQLSGPPPPLSRRSGLEPPDPAPRRGARRAILARRKNRTPDTPTIEVDTRIRATLLNEGDSIKARGGSRGEAGGARSDHPPARALQRCSSRCPRSSRAIPTCTHLWRRSGQHPRLSKATRPTSAFDRDQAEHPTAHSFRGQTAGAASQAARPPPPRKRHVNSRTSAVAAASGYSHGAHGPDHHEAFEAQQRPRYLISVGDSDVVKAYVGKGLGIAILPAMAFDENVDTQVQARDVTALFPRSTMTISFRHNAYLRKYAVDFIRMVPGVEGDDVKALA